MAAECREGVLGWKPAQGRGLPRERGRGSWAVEAQLGGVAAMAGGCRMAGREP